MQIFLQCRLIVMAVQIYCGYIINFFNAAQPSSEYELCRRPHDLNYDYEETYQLNNDDSAVGLNHAASEAGYMVG